MSRSRALRWVFAGTALAAVVAGTAWAVAPFLSKGDGRGPAGDPVGLPSTPAGITLQALGRAQGWDLGKETASILYRDEVAYADERGRTLYVHEHDAPGEPRCTGECAERFKPVVPLAGAVPVGEWTILTRADGLRQWALHGQPLYTYVEDADPGAVFGNSAARFGAKRKDGFGNVVGGGRRGSGVRGATQDKPPVPGWTPALIYPLGDRVDTPPNIRVAEVLDAAALSLVDHRGHTIYVSALPKAAEDAAVASGSWRPVAAPAVAVPRGEFAVAARDDGRSQWTWRGRRLFTYVDDLKAGDAYGVGADWQVAAVYRHFVPEGVTLQATLSQGLVWATAGGQTLYKRDGHIYQSGGGRSLHRGAPQRPAVGRDIGIDARCEGECAALWKPFLAPADALPRGYWDVYTRPDGSKQWAYQGFALYTYGRDQKPGDMLGHETYDMYFAMDPATRVDVGTPMDGIATLIWAVAYP